ncbi:MAG: DUF2079 domain-containing protein [Elusimicrobia bacterium]|nr:DUF2079 domain-containing protein [Elusimicrobiota bacterium]
MDWTRPACLAMEWAWALAGLLCLACAVIFALRPGLWARAEEKPETWQGARTSDLWAALIFGLALPGLLVLFKLAQFFRFELMWDSGVMANLAWNAAHGHGLTSSVIEGRSYLAVHFAFTVALFAPLIWLWPSVAVLVAAHGLAVGSSAWAVYLLGCRVCGRSSSGWLLALLACSHPFFHDITGSVLDSSIYALPLFLWGIWAWESGRRPAAALCALLILTTRETLPLLFFGMAAYGLLLSKERGARLLCAAMMGAAALALVGEQAIIRKAAAGWNGLDQWKLFDHLGGSPSAVLSGAVLRPWRLAQALVFPASKVLLVARVLLEFAGLPLAAGAAALPAALLWLPQQLANHGSMYHQLIGHNSVYIFGPLLWACAWGLRKLSSRLKPQGRALLAAWVLASAGAGFLRSARFLLPEAMNPAHWRTAGPRAIAAVPPQASVWCDEFFLPHLGMRRYVKSLLRSDDPYFEGGLFVPDRALVSTHWIRLAAPRRRDAVMGFLRERGFIEVFREKDIVVLANPKTLGKEGGEPEFVRGL